MSGATWTGTAERWALAVLILVLLSVPLRYGSLAEPLLSSGDEALTALRSLGLMEQGRYWTPYWNGEPNLHKPPLYYWLVATGYRIWGVGEFPLRLPSVALYLALIAVTFAMTRRLMDAQSGCIAAVLVAWNPVLFSQSRLGMMDTLVALLMLCGGYALWRADQDRRYLYLWGVSCGLSVMAKGLGAVAIVPLSFLYLAVVRPRWFLSGHLYAAFFAGMILPLLWFGSHYLMYREHFLREYVGHEIAYRVGHSVRSSFLAQKTTLRLWRAWGAFAPFGFAAPLLLLFAVNPGSSGSLFRERWKELLFVYLAFFVPLGLANLVFQQMYWYVLPSIPPMAILMALVIRSGAASRNSAVPILLTGVFASGALLAYTFDHASGSRWALLGGQSLCLLVMILFRRRSSVRGAALITAAALTLFLGVPPRNKTVNLSRYRDCGEEYRLASAIRERTDVPGSLVLNFRHYPANCLLFYSGRTFIDFRKFLGRDMAPGEARLGVFTDGSYRRIGGVQVSPLNSTGSYHLFRLDNTGDSPVRPRFEQQTSSDLLMP